MLHQRLQTSVCQKNSDNPKELLGNGSPSQTSRSLEFDLAEGCHDWVWKWGQFNAITVDV